MQIFLEKFFLKKNKKKQKFILCAISTPSLKEIGAIVFEKIFLLKKKKKLEKSIP